MNAGQDQRMIDIHQRSLDAIGETLITLQDDTIERMSDALEAAERERDELAAANATLEKRVRELTAERDAAQEQISAMRSAISPDRAHYIADDYAHLVGGECGYTKSLREYAKAACQP